MNESYSLTLPCEYQHFVVDANLLSTTLFTTPLGILLGNTAMNHITIIAKTLD